MQPLVLPLAVVLPRHHCRCAAESCRPSLFCPLPSSCRLQLSLCHVVVSPVAVIVPCCCAACWRCRVACCSAEHCRRHVARRFRPRHRATHHHRRVTRCCAAPCRCRAAHRRCRAASLCCLLPSALPSLPGGGVPWFVDLFVIDGDRWEAVLILCIPT